MPVVFNLQKFFFHYSLGSSLVSLPELSRNSMTILKFIFLPSQFLQTCDLTKYIKKLKQTSENFLHGCVS